MTNSIHTIFHNKKVIPSRLLTWGFEQHDTNYVYRKLLSASELELIVTITEQGDVSSEIVDTIFHEPYILHLIENTAGSFVGNIKQQYEKILTEIADCCFDTDVFQSAQAKELISYVTETYGDDLEYLWKKFPNNAIWRRKDTQKWYAALLTVSKRKLGIDSDETAEIIDLRIEPKEIETLIDNERYFLGYHMNKKHWYTIILDNSVPTAEICSRIDISYSLAK